ncbi:MAG TPA: hypothetical protein VLT33_09145 [Labilithrix sp.]|nr:hypothetical protein [Labilithrix sp.]
MPPKKPFAPRKLLVAAVGVASINYVAMACGGATDTSTNPPTSGNLPNPPALDGSPPPTSGNLAAPPPMDAGLDAADASDGDGGDAADDGGDAG